MNKRYLIFLRDAHSVIYFARGETPTDAIWNYISQLNENARLNADGSITDEADHYAHPLTYIEATEKIYHEWQMRELPDWAWEDGFSEIFCGESTDGPPSVIADCRKLFAEEFPKSRAKAFLWYLKEGALVTFYRKRGYQITVLKRYFWNWDGKQLTVEAWEGNYDKIMQDLELSAFRWHNPHSKRSRYPIRLYDTIPFDDYGKGSRIVVLSADVAAHFSDSETVNDALRKLV